MRSTGIDKAIKNLATLQRNAQELHGEHRVTLERGDGEGGRAGSRRKSNSDGTEQ